MTEHEHSIVCGNSMDSGILQCVLIGFQTLHCNVCAHAHLHVHKHNNSEIQPIISHVCYAELVFEIVSSL